MSLEQSGSPASPLLRAAPRRVSVVLLLAIGGGLGCVRTTSIGRAGGPTDAYADRDADAPADSDPTPAPDLRAEAAIDQGPIVGGGRDAATDGPDGPDAADATAAP